MTESASTRLDHLLEALCHAADSSSHATIDVRTLIPGLHMARRHVYAAILELTDAGYVEYAGAGPRVRITPAGRSHLEHLRGAAADG